MPAEDIDHGQAGEAITLPIWSSVLDGAGAITSLGYGLVWGLASTTALLAIPMISRLSSRAPADRLGMIALALLWPVIGAVALVAMPVLLSVVMFGVIARTVPTWAPILGTLIDGAICALRSCQPRPRPRDTIIRFHNQSHIPGAPFPIPGPDPKRSRRSRRYR